MCRCPCRIFLPEEREKLQKWHIVAQGNLPSSWVTDGSFRAHCVASLSENREKEGMSKTPNVCKVAQLCSSNHISNIICNNYQIGGCELPFLCHSLKQLINICSCVVFMHNSCLQNARHELPSAMKWAVKVSNDRDARDVHASHVRATLLLLSYCLRYLRYRSWGTVFSVNS